MSAYIFIGGAGDLCQHKSMSAQTIYIRIHDHMKNIRIGDLCQHKISMSTYRFNAGKGDLCQHMLSISLYMLIDGISDVCQHRLYMSEYMYNAMMAWVIKVIIGYLCQHTCSMLEKVIYVSICYLFHHHINHTCSLIVQGIHVSIDSICLNT